MLHLIQSNRMEVLAERLIALLKQHTDSADSLFEPESILVQSPGMAQWLKLQIAGQLGIAANLEFPLPSSFIWQLYRQHIADLPEQSAFSKQNLTWKLMAVLPGLLEAPEFAQIKGYLDHASDQKQYQLCHKIADVFDQYLVYRPDWILAWEQGQNQLEDVDIDMQPWQPLLWRKLTDFSKKLHESPYHRANLHLKLVQALSQTGKKKSAKPLFVFGISAMPQQQLEVLAALAEQTEVLIFWFNPCQHYWGDLVDSKTLAKAQLSQQDDYKETGNPLLSSWGKLGRDYQDMLLAMDIQQQDLFVEKTPSSLLEHIQYEILSLQFRGSTTPLSADELLGNGTAHPKIRLNEQDSSVQIQVCHSIVRELEALQDHLLWQFKQHPALTPGDIIVMVPDVSVYAPFIEGVFGDREDPLHIPYAISDRQLGDESALLSSFMQLMTLQQSRLALSDILTLLDVPALQAKFALSLDEVELIKVWLTETGVRWGWDGQDKARWTLPSEQQNTWLFGLHRLLAGYALDGSELWQTAPLGHVAPYAHIEGQEALALGKLYLFSQALSKALLFSRQRATLAQKVQGALALIEDFYQVEEREQLYLNQLRQALEQIGAQQHQYAAPVEQAVFVSELEQLLTDRGVGQRFLAGYVNFCTLMPMRSVPFKQVCLLGLTDGDYPRQTRPVGFDLMRQAKARRGDRSRRSDDRYLFLEALLSAREHLYLSYQGYSQRDNSPRSPSVLVSELVEYCLQCFCLGADHNLDADKTAARLHAHLHHYHPLQPFAPSNFQGDRPSFQSRWLAVAKSANQAVLAKAFFPTPLAPIEPASAEVSCQLDDLIEFFSNPAKAWFKRRWQTSLRIADSAVSDTEPFAIDALQRYQLNQRLLHDNAEQQQMRLQGEGVLPIGNAGQLGFNDLHAQNQILRDTFEQATGGNLAVRREILLQIEGISLQGWTDNLYGTDLVLWRPGKIRGKDKVELWLTWLCLCASSPAGGLGQARYLGVKDDFSIGAIKPEDAQAQLQRFLYYQQKGATHPLYFFPETSWQWMLSRDKDKTLDKFVGNRFLAGEGSEPHISRICPDLNAHFAEFIYVSEVLLGPLFADKETT